ncbi:unnamed protein product, partial [Phaeothamnion confervicola]
LYSYFFASCTLEAFDCICDITDGDGVKCWQKLVEKYSASSPTRINRIKKDLNNIKMSENETPDAYFSRIDYLRAELRDAERPVADDEIKTILLSGLSRNYSTIQTHLEYDCERYSLDEIKERM